MPSPFPGMDPFLEDPEIWPDFHADLAVELKRHLNRQMSAAYFATVEIQSVLDDIEVDIAYKIRPDVSIYEIPVGAVEPLAESVATIAIPAAPITRLAPLPTRLRAVRVYRTDTRELVTTIEILSPFNKRPASDGLSDFRRKRMFILTSHVHLVELDLLRGGERPGFEVIDRPLDTDYVLLVNRAGVERVSEIWPVALNETFPVIPIPLLPPDPDVPLDLNEAVREVYAGSRYERRIAYQAPLPSPPVRPVLREWVDNMLAGRVKQA